MTSKLLVKWTNLYLSTGENYITSLSLPTKIGIPWGLTSATKHINHNVHFIRILAGSGDIFTEVSRISNNYTDSDSLKTSYATINS